MFDWITEIPSQFLFVFGGILISLLIGVVYDLRGTDSLGLPIALASAFLFLVIGTPVAALLAGFTIGDIFSVLMAGLFIIGIGAAAISALLIALFVILSVLWPVR